MARSKAAKRAARRKMQAKAMAKAPFPTRKTVLGRPRERRDVGPTAQTLANLKPDTLTELHRLGIIDKQDVEAGHDIDRCWGMRVPNDIASYGAPGSVGGSASEVLQLTWIRWCGIVKGQLPPHELYRRCMVQPGKIVQWMRDFSSCDSDPKGAAGTLKRALMWWRLAARDVARAR